MITFDSCRILASALSLGVFKSKPSGSQGHLLSEIRAPQPRILPRVAIHNIVYMLYADWSFRLSVPAEQLILSVGFRDGSESTKVDINSFISELTKLIRLE